MDSDKIAHEIDRSAGSKIRAMFDDHAETLSATRDQLADTIGAAAAAVIAAYRAGRKVLVFGNGGSFSDALHIEGELTNRFHRDHEGLPAVASPGAWFGGEDASER